GADVQVGRFAVVHVAGDQAQVGLGAVLFAHGQAQDQGHAVQEIPRQPDKNAGGDELHAQADPVPLLGVGDLGEAFALATARRRRHDRLGAGGLGRFRFLLLDAVGLLAVVVLIDVLVGGGRVAGAEGG